MFLDNIVSLIWRICHIVQLYVGGYALYLMFQMIAKRDSESRHYDHQVPVTLRTCIYVHVHVSSPMTGFMSRGP